MAESEAGTWRFTAKRLEAERDSLLAEKAAWEEEKRSLTAERDGWMQNADQCIEAIDEMDAQMQALKAERDALRQQLAETEEERDRWKSLYSPYRDKALDAELDATHAQLAEVERLGEALASRIEVLEENHYSDVGGEALQAWRDYMKAATHG